MVSEQERFEKLMHRYFPYIPLSLDRNGEYTDTHVSVAYAMYLWGITDAKLVRLNTTFGSGWEVEIPPDMQKVLGDNLSGLYED